MKYLFELIAGNPIVFILVIVIVCFQVFYFFKKTRSRIKELKEFFPDLSQQTIVETLYSPSKFKTKKDLDLFVESPARFESEFTEDEDYDIISLIQIPSSMVGHNAYREVIHKTNVYLCKNSGSSADFSILKDICERQVDICEDEIHNTLNAPLYLGLAGTFLGIIAGLWGIDLNAVIGGSANSLAPFQHLLGGVVIAMLASLAGLILTIINSQFNYKDAARKVDTDKDEYYDFLQRELMPTLSTTMASSLEKLRSVLGNFVGNFGKNLDAYTGSISLLNDNIKEEHEVLVEINKLNLSKTATKIAETFNSMKSAAESLDVFRGYEDELNKTMTQTKDALKSTLEEAGNSLKIVVESAGDNLSKSISEAGNMISKTYDTASKNLLKTVTQVDVSVGRLEEVIKAFDDFGQALKLVVANQTKATELQGTFQKAIETHFPIGSSSRDMWQKEYDQLNKDALEASSQLQQELSASTQYVKSFVDNNREFFTTFDQLKAGMSEISNYAKAQVDCYNGLRDEIEALRKNSKESQIETVNLHKALLEAIKTMTIVLNTKKEL